MIDNRQEFQINEKIVDNSSIEKVICGLDPKDHPDYSDAYYIVEYAEFTDHTPLNDDELEKLAEELEIDYDDIISENFGF